MNTYINYCGPVKSGKTTILGSVIERLKSQSFVSVVFEKKSKPKSGNPVEYRIVLEINGQIIAISTYGDSLVELQKNHILFDQYNAKVMVTASHTHENHGHNLFIDNYVHNPIQFDNQISQTRIKSENKGIFNYIKIHSIKFNNKVTEQKAVLKQNRENYLYNIILESLNL